MNERKIRDLEEQLTTTKRARASKGLVRTYGKRPVLDGQDRINWGIVMTRVDDYFRGDKMLQKNWHVYTEVEGSLSQRLMIGLDIPFGYDRSEYYEERLVPQVLMKWKSLKTNFNSCARTFVDKSVRSGDGVYLKVKECFLGDDNNFLTKVLENNERDEMRDGVLAMYWLMCSLVYKFYKLVRYIFFS